MRSFDVFDTLISRRQVNPESVWHAMARDIDIPHFVRIRSHYDGAKYSLRDVYEDLAKVGLIELDHVDLLCRLELQYEQDNAFPIKENMDKVQDGDVLISDMYMTAADILNLVRSAGMNKQVTVYQSNIGKQTGQFWQSVQGKFKPEYHIGDNVNSDYNQAKQYGVNAVHFKNEITDIEKGLIDKGLAQLALLTREVRLRNNETVHGDIFNTACQLNLPWLFIASELLRRCQGLNRYAFLGRDCQLLYKIYNAFFDTSCYYVPFSRQPVLTNVHSAVSYLNSQVPQNTVLVDISSTGTTWEKLAQINDYPVRILIYSDQYHYSHCKPVLPKNFTWLSTTTVFGPTNKMLEIFNCADHGRVAQINLIGSLPVVSYAPHDMAKELVDVIHAPVRTAVTLNKFYDVKTDLAKVTDEELHKMFSGFQQALCKINTYDHKFKDYYAKDFDYGSMITSLCLTS